MIYTRQGTAVTIITDWRDGRVSCRRIIDGSIREYNLLHLVADNGAVEIKAVIAAIAVKKGPK